jgi:Cu-Zn family superoxide dismutase
MILPLDHLAFLAAATLPLALYGCANQESSTRQEPMAQEPMTQAEQEMPEPSPEAAQMEDEPKVARAELQPAKGKKVMGTVMLTQTDEGVTVEANLQGLAPGKHGFHIHEKGDCSASDFTSAGDHFNPTGDPHGAPHDDERHLGDLGNIEAAADGTATVRVTMPDLTLEERGENSAVGKAIVVHEKADDLQTQPSGAAGGRIACGVIIRTSVQPSARLVEPAAG